jgi:ubiquinone/menaquinone biosynthesis C-methylase UbiE
VNLHSNAFLDPSQIRGALYQDASRLIRRSSALTRAKTTGRYVPDVITAIAAKWLPDTGSRRIADIGCGRGSTTLALVSQFPTDRITGIDLSPALLTSAAQRLQAEGHSVPLLCADFHHLPLSEESCDLIVAAFCLYHAPEPTLVIAEIARCLSTEGIAILVTKSEDSYRQLDLLVARAGLDPEALTRPSLYSTANSSNLPTMASTHLEIPHVVHELHTFSFINLHHVAEYLVTTPKYALPEALSVDSGALAGELRNFVAEDSVTMTSTITYVVARSMYCPR